MMKIIIRNNFGDLNNEYWKFEHDESQTLFKKKYSKIDCMEEEEYNKTHNLLKIKHVTIEYSNAETCYVPDIIYQMTNLLSINFKQEKTSKFPKDIFTDEIANLKKLIKITFDDKIEYFFYERIKYKQCGKNMIIFSYDNSIIIDEKIESINIITFNIYRNCDPNRPIDKYCSNKIMDEKLFFKNLPSTLKYLQITCPDYQNDDICANLPSTLKKLNLIFERCSPNDPDCYQDEVNRLKIPQNCKVTVRETNL